MRTTVAITSVLAALMLAMHARAQDDPREPSANQEESASAASGACRCGQTMEWVQLAPQGAKFELADSGRRFVPWGFNYDHEGDGRLLEDYWVDQWDRVDSAFREMKQLGANTVRIHLQFGKFMVSEDVPNATSLHQLRRLVQLAEEVGIYLDITGLGCYHKADVPAWYDQLDEPARWAAQAAFWRSVAATCADSPAVFCYDLMNEPVVPGGDGQRSDWLGPAFAGKHFVQFIALDRQGRERSAIARQWISTLVEAIRQHDSKHLITVGLVPWSLDRPGLTSGFSPPAIADLLDFLAVHVYPEAGKVDDAIDIVRAFAATGKPVVVEETFTLKCGANDLETFIDGTRNLATGWIGFYWGQTPEEIRPAQSIPASLTLSWLELFQRKTDTILGHVRAVRCEGRYPGHLQGICATPEHIFWSFTTDLVKTDLAGRIVARIEVPTHHGDLCCRGDRLYVAVNLGQFNHPQGHADSWVYVYDQSDLELVSKHPVPEVRFGAGGIGYREGRFFVVGGLPPGIAVNYVYEYNADFEFARQHTIASGSTLMGIQTAAYWRGCWFFGCYGTPRVLLVTDSSFRLLGRYAFDCAYGVDGTATDRLLVAEGACENGQCWGGIFSAIPDPAAGLRRAEP
ncbi:MAG: hypothetical protein D6753_13845 [Planctomycetota bacterium]|nr:MAG: hypothetical protein D6753_13845 [Planctomycetota bacterium]